MADERDPEGSDEDELEKIILQYDGVHYHHSQHAEERFAEKVNGILIRSTELCEQKHIQSMLLPHLALLWDIPLLKERLYASFPLHYAVMSEAPANLLPSLVSTLPKALTEKVGTKCETALHLAASHRHDKTVFEILASPEAVRTANRLGDLPLHTYCKHGAEGDEDNHLYYPLETDLVEFLVGLYPESVNKLNDAGLSALHLACCHATEVDLPSIQYLVALSTLDVIVRADDHGQCVTPLHVACDSGSRASPEVIHYLIQALPDNVRALRTKSGSTPLHELCSNEHYPGADGNYAPSIQELVEAHPQSLLSLDSGGSTPLHLLCFTADASDISTLRFLLQQYPGALRVVNKEGYTPLHIACSEVAPRDVDVIRLLSGECPELHDPKGQAADGSETPLHSLVLPSWGSHTSLKSSMEALGRVSEDFAKVKDQNGRTAFHLLSKVGADQEDLQYLLEKFPGAISEKDNQGRLPLHLAAEGRFLSCGRCSYYVARYSETVKCLLDAFPDAVMTKDNDGKTPLDLACEKDEDLSLIYQLVSVNPVAIMGLGGRSVAPPTRKRKRTDS